MKATDFDLGAGFGRLGNALGGKGATKKLRKEFQGWLGEVEDVELVRRGRQLWKHLHSDEVSKGEKLVLLAALIYLISPVDLVSDAIPVLGWLDDIGVAGVALSYVMRRMEDKQDGTGKKTKKGKKGSKAKKQKRRRPPDAIEALTSAFG